MRMRSIWIGARALVLLSFVFSQARTSSAHQERVPDSLQVQTALTPGKAFSFEEDGKTMWLKKPTGERFFSLGVCVVGMGASRADLNPTNPGYAAFQHYESSNRWAEATVKRLKSWGF